MGVNKLLLLKGESYRVTDLVAVNNPTLGEIVDFGEQEYWDLLTHLCATSFDYRLFLEEKGVRYEDIDDWQMFLNMHSAFDYEETKILIPGINLAKLHLYKEENSGQVVMVNDDGVIVINDAVYYSIMDFIRKCHGVERNFKIAGNKTARDIYMREAREAHERDMRGQRKNVSYLEPLVSALCNTEGFKYNFDTVWNLPIYTFMDATRRIPKIKSADHFMNGMYGGMLDVSKMTKAQLNKNLDWMGELK